MTAINDTVANYFAASIKTADDVRATLKALAEVGVTWHPDDDPVDIVWSIDISEAAKTQLRVITDELRTACDDNGLDIYEESMQAHVRVHGHKSCFYPEHRPYELRKYMCFWGCGYNDEGKVTWEVCGVDSFTDDNGYDQEYIDAILDLELEETWDHTDPGGHHWIVRIA